MGQSYPQYAAQKLLTQRAVERTPRRSHSTERWLREKAEQEKREHDRRVKVWTRVGEKASISSLTTAQDYFEPRPNGAFIPDWAESTFDEGPISPPIRNFPRSRSRNRRNHPSRSSTQSSGAALRVGIAQQEYDDYDLFNGNGLPRTRDRPPTLFFSDVHNPRAEPHPRPSSRSTTGFWPSPVLSGDGSVPTWLTNGRTSHISPYLILPPPMSSPSSTGFRPSPAPSEFGAPLRRFDHGRTRYDSPDLLARADSTRGSSRGSGRSAAQTTRLAWEKPESISRHRKRYPQRQSKP
ncbi:hypothetical protein AC578_10808 [Pseudocercospora eumusae]|uniref:Uncharacterized protein n=1 Tax=Pseudocercospora eumusae TaxID=321146 RepID=A0A139H3K5_9PEZI|nr:hypothetical protein AC578_10808 [Pseudocercospora eumusae]